MWFGRAPESMNKVLDQLRAQGQTPKPERQVGAWQSFETTPYSKIQHALGMAAAQTKVLSRQHEEELDEATFLVSEFSKNVDNFMKTKWVSFENTVKNSNLRVQE